MLEENKEGPLAIEPAEQNNEPVAGVIVEEIQNRQHDDQQSDG